MVEQKNMAAAGRQNKAGDGDNMKRHLNQLREKT